MWELNPKVETGVCSLKFAAAGVDGSLEVLTKGFLRKCHSTRLCHSPSDLFRGGGSLLLPLEVCFSHRCHSVHMLRVKA